MRVKEGVRITSCTYFPLACFHSVTQWLPVLAACQSPWESSENTHTWSRTKPSTSESLGGGAQTPIYFRTFQVILNAYWG